MNFVKRLKALKNQSKEAPPVITVKFEKQCPHCAGRGMFVFNDTPKISKTINELELKDQCQYELVED